ncbi:hypothetical protein TWF481_007818 [Arthrobotrys musiformis]|uniref:Uncharacterized protein n=1 Tax=Arthrobotrys musiformis TaxID=47236 RepID=A0AAV9W6A0_9PEZI
MNLAVSRRLVKIFYDYKARNQKTGYPGSLDINDNPRVLRAFTDSELEIILKDNHPTEGYRFYWTSHLECVPLPLLEAIFAKHDFNSRLLETPIYDGARQATPIGARSLRDERGEPAAYDIYIVLPTRAYHLSRKPELAGAYSSLEADDPWIILWRECSEGIGWNTKSLDEQVQNFILSEGDQVESEYSELNAKIHINQIYTSRMHSDIRMSKLRFEFVQEQHLKFLEFTGLKSESSVRVQEELTGLLVDIKDLDVSLKQELDKLRSSSAWLSTSISLKHTKAMRVAGDESRQASLALKENTDAMKANDDLLREFAQKTLDVNQDVKQNGVAMREIAEESKKIAEANIKESETMTRIAKNTQRDSRSMKVLAFLTTMYLPGAFVSSIFGWSIISFDVADDGTQQIVVAEQWRIFVVSTVVLTVITMVGCFTWIWISQKRAALQRARTDSFRRQLA